MSFSKEEVQKFLNKDTVTGVIHVGAHLCEEMDYYKNFLELTDSSIVWVDGNKQLVEQSKNKYPSATVFYGVCSDQAGQTVTFNITNNGQSSSILPLGTHKQHHPYVWYVEAQTHITTTVDNLLAENNIPHNVANMMNLDVQGAELLVLKGSTKVLENIKYIFTEVNEEYVYENCALITELDDFLGKLGFERVLTRINNCKWGDAFYIRK
jgi:FkbM family methyltransferase